MASFTGIRACLAASLFLAAWGCLRPSPRPSGPPADLVVVNAQVLTLDDKRTTAEAVAVSGGRFVAIGTNAEIKGRVGPTTRVFDAGGKSVIPGLIDTHVHAIGVAEGEVVEPFEELSSIADMQAWLRRKAARTPEGAWITLTRVDITRIRERRFPTRTDLDAATTRHPVLFTWAFGVVVNVLNTRGLETLGITPNTPAPRDGQILKDGSGDLTGQLRNASGLIPRDVTRWPELP